MAAGPVNTSIFLGYFINFDYNPHIMVSLEGHLLDGYIRLQRTLYAYIIVLAVIRNLQIVDLYEPRDIKLLVQQRKCKHYKTFCTSIVLGIMHCSLPRLKWLYEHASVT